MVMETISRNWTNVSSKGRRVWGRGLFDHILNIAREKLRFLIASGFYFYCVLFIDFHLALANIFTFWSFPPASHYACFISMKLQDQTKSIKASSATIRIQKNNTTVKQIKHM